LRQAYDYWQDQPGNCCFLIPKDFPFPLFPLGERREKRKNALQRLPSGRGFFLSSKGKKKKPFQG
jgi:hypothetical protein